MKSRRIKLTKLQKALFFLSVIIIYISIGLYYDLKTTDYEITSPKLPKSFDGYKIANISDLHSSYFGDNQEELINAIKDFEPDIIVLTGDIIDENNVDYQCVSKLLTGICDIAPIYSVSGNHEHSNYRSHIKLKKLLTIHRL